MDTPRPDVAARSEPAPWAETLGVRRLDARRGHCRVSLRVRPHLLDARGVVDLGVIASLAHAAFAGAAASHGEPATALTVTIQHLAPAGADTTLIAEAHELRRGRQAAFYAVAVTSEDGRAVARAHYVAQRVRP